MKKESTVKHRGSIVMVQNKKLEAREKIRIIRDQLAGKYSIKEAAQRAGVTRTTFQSWK